MSSWCGGGGDDRFWGVIDCFFLLGEGSASGPAVRHGWWEAWEGREGGREMRGKGDKGC